MELDKEIEEGEEGKRPKAGRHLDSLKGGLESLRREKGVKGGRVELVGAPRAPCRPAGVRAAATLLRFTLDLLLTTPSFTTSEANQVRNRYPPHPQFHTLRYGSPPLSGPLPSSCLASSWTTSLSLLQSLDSASVTPSFHQPSRPAPLSLLPHVPLLLTTALSHFRDSICRSCIPLTRLLPIP